MMTDLVSLVGGRAAEEIVIGSVTNGASDDIKKATNLAKVMITQYGMSEKFGLVALSTVEDQYLSGHSQMNCSPTTEAQIDEEVRKMIMEAYEEAKSIIKENREVMDKLAHYLYDHETITGKEFMKIFREAKGIPEPVDTSDFTTSEKVAESVTFNEDGTYSSTISGPAESEIWKDANEDLITSKETEVEETEVEETKVEKTEVEDE
jgi:cell division protease FtsH